MKIEKMVIVAANYNGMDAETTYNGTTETQALRDLYIDQGGLYLALFGVTKKDAAAAGWDPENRGFCGYSDGWDKFLQDKGKIAKTVKTEEIPIKDYILSKMV